jgi:hypothetical protein
MKFYSIFIIAILLISCNDNYTSFNKNIVSYQSNVKLIDINRKYTIDCKTFDINKYFSFYDKLEFDNSYDYKIKIWDIGNGGYPIYFALPKNRNLKIYDQKEPPFFFVADSTKYNSSINAGYSEDSVYLIYSDYNKKIKTYPRIKLKDTTNRFSFFQLIVFHEYNNNFCRIGESNYGIANIITSKKDIEDVLNNKFFNRYKHFSKNQKVSALMMSFKPEINIQNDTCFISIVKFNAWYGFYREYYSITKKQPYVIRSIKDSVLIRYDIGIMF